MTVRWVLILCLVLCRSAHGVQRPELSESLRRLTRLPRVELSFSLEFDPARGFTVFSTARDPNLAAAELRKSLTGTPADGEKLQELALVHMDRSDRPQAQAHFKLAADAFRTRLNAQGGSAELRVKLAGALQPIRRTAEAESLLREAVAMTPQSASNWIALSFFLEVRAWATVTEAANPAGRRPYGDLIERALGREASSQAWEEGARQYDEALHAAKRAAAEDPKLPEAWSRLGACEGGWAGFNWARRRLGEAEESAQGLAMAPFTGEALTHFSKAAEADPARWQARATALLWRVLSAARERGAVSLEAASLPFGNLLPDSVRREAQDDLAALESAAEKQSRAGVAQAMGTLRLVIRRDYAGAAEWLRKAAAADPESEQVWETLLTALGGAGDWAGFAASCGERVLERGTARNRALLAGALAKIGEHDRAFDQVDAALAGSPNDFYANVGLANLLMRDWEEGHELNRTREALVKAERALGTAAVPTQLVDLALAQAIYHGLTGNTDRARAILKTALARAKDDPELAAALEIVGE